MCTGYMYLSLSVSLSLLSLSAGCGNCGGAALHAYTEKRGSEFVCSSAWELCARASERDKKRAFTKRARRSRFRGANRV